MSPSAKTIVQSANIPPIPGVLQQILSLADNPNTTGAQLEKIVSQEPLLVAKLLKWVNSAQYALPKRVSSVGHAMVMLGFSTVKSVASGMVLINAFDELQGVGKDVVNDIWHHTLLAANFSKILTKREPMGKQDDIFLACMIHDVGRLVMFQYFQKKYQTLCKGSLLPTSEEETQAFQVDHAQIAAELLEEWRFPEDVIYMVKCHHKPRSYPGTQKDINFVMLSDSLSQKKDLKTLLLQNAEQVDPSLLEMLKVINSTWQIIQSQGEALLGTQEMVDKLFHGS